MTLPLPEDLPAPRRPVSAHQGGSPADNPREREKLARKWAYLVSTTAYIPLSHPEVEQRLQALVDILVGTVRAEPFLPAPAAPVGAELVALNCVGPESLERSVDVLGRALLALPSLRRVNKLTDRVVMVLAALTSGYLEAFRAFIFQQQEALNRALFKAANDAERQRKDSDARLEEVFRCSASGIAITDLDGAFLKTNTAVHELLGYTAEELTELTLFDLVAPDERASLRNACADLRAGRVDRLRQQRKRMLHKEEEPLWALLSVSLQPSAGQEPGRLVTVIADDTQVTALQKTLNRQSLHDMVTTLPNRQYFSTAAETMLRRADPATGVTLYHLDLDAFAAINNGYGAEVGDRLLRIVADRLLTIFEGEETIIARLGGDEFAVLVRNSANTPKVLTMVRRIDEELSEPVYLNDTTGVAVSATIGVVHQPRPGISAIDLMRTADLTLRRVKRTGHRQWAMFDQGKDCADRDDFRIAGAMAGAWENGEVQLRHRPVVRLADQELLGLEALLHWDSPEFGPLDHDRCRALAESTGLIVPLGSWLLQAAAERNRRRVQRSGREQPLLVSLTPTQVVEPDFTCVVQQVVNDTGLPSEQLRLGIPVAALASPMAVDNLTDLADSGVRITLDDFGSATGEIEYLEDLPVSAVRVSRSLVARQAAQPASLTSKALRELVATAQLAGATVLVDGVHTQTQADWWRAVGAESATGDLFTADLAADPTD
ncbi:MULTISPECIES: bifunctional diguanylate cyclase/phosphodiesterase [unclassified Crossiella]|uniref:putative bifunctional diguanylate cyclase/phosphodiesterase n=1 Tax=unclassified Crossiella TaxID=2620835 RepID=UPI001FFF0447|nr:MULTISPECIES: EAL domain-containing protein [unclassified Crossiella]MCK2244023.1 EAL domain-containing protein [Crossiella sp. S99.2]MCK2257119.1 EAL domain-containing protein [Crossiella sp. S99.1]